MAVATDLHHIARDYLDSFVAYLAETDTAARLVPIVDSARGHFLLYEIGHENGEWIYEPWLHLKVDPDDRIRILCNRTDVPIAAELIERGVPRAAIVIGWLESPSQPPAE